MAQIWMAWGRGKWEKMKLMRACGKKMCNSHKKIDKEKLSLVDEDAVETEHGSGFAAAVEQPRRPQ
jgi:hypothetical protein